MVHDIVTSLAPADVLERAIQFFAERVPNNAAYPEQQGASYLVLRGQGGEEIAFSATVGEAGTRVRASTLFFDQAISRFFTTLPTVTDSAGAAPGEQETFA
jgi:hypothetical protein